MLRAQLETGSGPEPPSTTVLDAAVQPPQADVWKRFLRPPIACAAPPTNLPIAAVLSRRRGPIQQGHDLGGLIRFSQRDGVWGERLASVVDEHLLPAMEEFELDFEDLEGLLGEQWPWTLWGCAFEDFLSRRWEPDGQNVIDVYLKRRGWSEKVLNRAYIEGLRDANVSLYEVSEVKPGVSMKLRDLLTGAELVIVREKSATRSLKQWDRIAVRVVPVRDHYLISGGLLPFSWEATDLLFEGLRDSLRLRKSQEVRLTAAQLHNFAPLLSSAWLFAELPRVLVPKSPQVTNTDGEDLLFHELRFPFAKGVLQSQVSSALGRVIELEPSGTRSWNWLAPKSGRKQEQRQRKAPGLAVGSFSEGATVLGTIELKGKALILQVNSKNRALRGEAFIRDATGDLLRPPLTKIQTVAQIMREGEDRMDGHREAADEVPPEIAHQIILEHLDRHYHETLDQPVPALAGKTPRQAVRSPSGRKKVVEWLKYVENASTKNIGTPMAEYDFGWMWDELGLGDERQ